MLIYITAKFIIDHLEYIVLEVSKKSRLEAVEKKMAELQLIKIIKNAEISFRETLVNKAVYKIIFLENICSKGLIIIQ